ncbi:unnamed protein product, partial [Musa hybrid cultivar]
NRTKEGKLRRGRAQESRNKEDKQGFGGSRKGRERERERAAEKRGRKDGNTVIGIACIQFDARTGPRTAALLESQAVALLLVSSLDLYWKGGRFFRFRLISHWREEHRRPYEREKVESCQGFPPSLVINLVREV